GLMSFDNEHEKKEKKESARKNDPRVGAGARVELHPVWGLAIHVADDRWVFLVRNWGNEGSCSNGFDITRSKWQHWLPLPQNEMKFFLPLTAGAAVQTAPDFHCAYYRSGDPIRCDGPPQVKTQSLANGVLVSIQLSQPEVKELVWGEIRISGQGR